MAKSCASYHSKPVFLFVDVFRAADGQQHRFVGSWSADLGYDIFVNKADHLNCASFFVHVA